MPDRSLLSETRALSEYWQLVADPVYRGRGVPQGNNDLVIVLPGLFGNDTYLSPLRDWLRRIGHQPALSTIPLNVGCPSRLQERVLRNLERRIANTTGPIAIIGHSRGGLLGKALATRIGDQCTRLIALGSPLGIALRAGEDRLLDLMQPENADLAARPVANAGRMAMKLFSPDCRFPACGCSYVQDLLGPLGSSTQVTAIYSKEDPVVAPEASIIDGAENISVTGSHGGLVTNRMVYRALAQALVA
ncbi:MAG: hypothetical protein AAGG11_22045 [Pseudomonadota bacterium]